MGTGFTVRSRMIKDFLHGFSGFWCWGVNRALGVLRISVQGFGVYKVLGYVTVYLWGGGGNIRGYCWLVSRGYL